MSSRTTDGRQLFRALTGLDVGLRVRIRRQPSQGALFSGAPKLSVEVLSTELAGMVSGLVVYSCSARQLMQS